MSGGTTLGRGDNIHYYTKAYMILDAQNLSSPNAVSTTLQVLVLDAIFLFIQTREVSFA